MDTRDVIGWMVHKPQYASLSLYSTATITHDAVGRPPMVAFDVAGQLEIAGAILMNAVNAEWTSSNENFDLSLQGTTGKDSTNQYGDCYGDANKRPGVGGDAPGLGIRGGKFYPGAVGGIGGMGGKPWNRPMCGSQSSYCK